MGGIHNLKMRANDLAIELNTIYIAMFIVPTFEGK